MLTHLYLWFDGLLSSNGGEPPLKIWYAKLLLPSFRIRVLLSTCGVQVGSSLVAVCGSSLVVVGDSSGVESGA